MIIDSHCHVSLVWYEPIEILINQMKLNGVERAVLVQIHGETNNSYLIECAARDPERFAAVVAVDLKQPDIAGQMRDLRNRGASGFRLSAADVGDTDSTPEAWIAANEFGLPVSCQGTTDQFASREFAKLVQSTPMVPVVLEHLGGMAQPVHGRNPEDEFLRVAHLAQYPNVHVKIHGLGEFCERQESITGEFPFKAPVPQILDSAIKHFGHERIMWGSNHPLVSRSEGYRNALQLPKRYLDDRPEHEIDRIFGGSALDLFWSHT